jgi:hypothetical protein
VIVGARRQAAQGADSNPQRSTRFVAHGPSIPGELLEQRDRGNVVFFCGAGVSMPAGLPNFPKLTERVMQVS